MKTLTTFTGFTLTLICLLAFVPQMNGQLLKRLGDRAEKAAERTIERRVEKETQEKTDQALDSILEPGKKGKQTTDKMEVPVPSGDEPDETSTDPRPDNRSENPEVADVESGPKSISVYSKFDFVPGDKVLFYDDFSSDYVGDFPSKWDTNGGGEVVALEGSSEKWFEVKAGSTYIPALSDLPEEYTIEFDLLALGVDEQTSGGAKLGVSLTENNSYDWYKSGENSVNFELPLCQYAPVDIQIQNKINKETLINNRIEADVRAAMLDRPHVSIAVNGQRFRLWINQVKYVDVPKLAPSGSVMNYLRFDPVGMQDAKDRIFIGNLKIAQGGVDLRKKLIAEGKVTTNGILFDVGSANIQPQSMGIIRQISQVLQEENAMTLKIVGHTDADGSDTANLELSKKRADAIKNALVSVYQVSSDRLTTEGKGEKEPVGDNATADGKAQNRRVEFIKQ